MFTPSEFSIVFITTNRKQCVLHSLYRRSVRAGSRLVIFTNHVGFRFSVKSQLASVTSFRESRFGLSGADQGSLTPGDQLVCTLESTACHFLPPFLFLFFFAALAPRGCRKLAVPSESRNRLLLQAAKKMHIISAAALKPLILSFTTSIIIAVAE